MTVETISKACVVVDYTKSLQDMIAAGHYDWINSYITPKRFPITGTGVVELETKVFHFKSDISLEDAVAAIVSDDEDNPWEPATIEELLAYGAKHPDEQRQYPIVAPGSVAEVDGDRSVPYLDRYGARRDLRLSWWVYDWNDDCRFLAVRKLSSAA